MDIALEWDQHPGTGLRLAAELAGWTGLPLLEDISVADGTADLLGVIAARGGGELLGWAELRDAGLGEAWVQAVSAQRLVHSLNLGRADESEPQADETEMVCRLTAEAARRAAAGGYRVLRWQGTDIGPSGRAAVTLGARRVDEYARLWELNPVASRYGYPAARNRLVHTVAESDDPPGRVLITAVLSARNGVEPVATITTFAGAADAYISAEEGFPHREADADLLTEIFGAVVAELRSAMPEITVLRVFEFDDETVREALSRIGMRICGRYNDYELELGSPR
ncbi:hypothetical protein NONO_c41230 [Nocardia nova SH22a]|uniref:Uncharacterized protein n=1 Tax=Nocardia nova SH22a TaxID=1415166 RepID=W5TI52_9NOCA|nr:hypothetical protein [Nocardia nova]AHH18907.1 hypothetical protein NONO_c41230 [Nocardia nova SH22a]